MSSYQKHQFFRNGALDAYLNQVKQNPNIGTLELANKLNKSKGVVSHYLKKLVNKGQIKIEADGQKYFYSIAVKDT